MVYELLVLPLMLVQFSGVTVATELKALSIIPDEHLKKFGGSLGIQSSCLTDCLRKPMKKLISQSVVRWMSEVSR